MLPACLREVRVRIGRYNVENLFNRARALDQRTWSTGRPALEAYEQACQLLEEPVYTAEVKAGIERQLRRLDLWTGDTARFARLRQNRGRLLRRARAGPVPIVAGGRGGPIGWGARATPPGGAKGPPTNPPGP